MSTNQETKMQLVINSNNDGFQNVILDGVLLFKTNQPDIADILDAYGLTAENTVVLVDGIYNNDYITKQMNEAVTFEKPQVDENVVSQIPDVSFQSNSENLLRAAGVDPVYAKAGSELPTIGDSIYIPSQNGIFVNILGGKATVEEVLERSNVHYILTSEAPNVLFRWSEIAFFQNEMAKDFGNNVAKIESTY